MTYTLIVAWNSNILIHPINANINGIFSRLSGTNLGFFAIPLQIAVRIVPYTVGRSPKRRAAVCNMES